jgi:replicative DNA helicase
MSLASITERAVAADGLIDGWRIRSGQLADRDWIHFTKSASHLAELPIELDDRTAGLNAIRSVARRWRADSARGGACEKALLVVDYLQLVEPDAQRGKKSNRQEDVAEISRGMKALAKEIGCPVVALSQLNRNLEGRGDKRPQLSDLRESGAVEQDADVIAFIYRDEVYNAQTTEKGIAEVIVAKQRNGPTGTVRLGWQAAHTRFVNLSNRSEMT